MFGTVARLSVKPGMEQKLEELSKGYDRMNIPGFVSTYVYRMDSNPNEYYMAVAFEDRDSYFKNANSPEQDKRYREMLDCLTSEPEWHDGEIVHAMSQAKTSAF